MTYRNNQVIITERSNDMREMTEREKAIQRDREWHEANCKRNRVPEFFIVLFALSYLIDLL